MKFQGFVGPSYRSQSVTADIERTMNWYVEAVESPGAPFRSVLLPTPGFQKFVGATEGITDVGARAAYAINGRAFFVIGGGFYEVTADKKVTRRGSVAQDGNPATISCNTIQLLITSGGNAYCFVLATNAFSQVLTGEATQGGMIDEYGLVFNAATGICRVGALNDFTSWPGGQSFANSTTPDPWKSMLVDGSRRAWFWGDQTGQVWYDANPSSTQPFLPVGGAVFRSGIAGTFGAALAGNNIVWLEANSEGAGRVIAARGYDPEPVGDYAVHTAIGNYARTVGISDAEPLVYQDQGHTFFNLSFPKADATLSLDVDRPSWHERGAWKGDRYGVWKPRAHCYAFGLHLVGDRSSGTISVMDVSYGTEADGSIIRRLRIAPAIAEEAKRQRFNQLLLAMDRGVGTATGQGADPQVMLRMSYDGGQTWGAERLAGFGRQGRYRSRVYWNRLGLGDNVAVQVAVSDPAPARIAAALINPTEAELQQVAA